MINNLLKKDFKIVQHKHKFFMVPLIIAAFAFLFAGLIWTNVKGSPLKLGMDFGGGYSLNIVYGAQLTEDNRDEKLTELRRHLSEFRHEGVDYKITMDSYRMQGSGDTAALYIMYKATGVESDEHMLAINKDLQEYLNRRLFGDDMYGGHVTQASMTSGSVSNQLLTRALLAVLVASILLLIYIAIRFELLQGLAAVVAQLHDVLFMFAFMAITHMEINGTFIAAIITIMGYSLNNTIIVFDRVRENKKNPLLAGRDPTYITNLSIKETLTRSINTSFSTLITIGTLLIVGAAAGISAITFFAAPLVVGIIAGTYSSTFIAPSLYAAWAEARDRIKRKRIAAGKLPRRKKEKIAETP